MRPRAQSYITLDGLAAERDAVPWYWRLVAIGASLMILGGFLILPATFEDSAELKVSAAGLGIFGVALLTAGFALTGLLAFAVPNPLFQADAVLLPALTFCAIGLLTILYNFLVFTRYVWRTPALLLTLAGAIGTAVYFVLFIVTQRRLRAIKNPRAPSSGLGMGLTPLVPAAESTATVTRNSESSTLYQDAAYYDNYVRNMFPASIRPPGHQGAGGPNNPGYDPNSITEEEMQRQQMLMLLLRQQDPPAPDRSQSTFRIDWQGREDDDDAPPQSYYAPTSATSVTRTPDTAYHPNSRFPTGPSPALVRRFTSELQPWDGVWRTPARIDTNLAPPSQRNAPLRADSQASREARRAEIERGQ